jgi:hypothetical protein
LRRHLSASHFRQVRRARLRATSAYVRAAGRNAAVLVRSQSRGRCTSTRQRRPHAASQRNLRAHQNSYCASLA